MIRLAMILNLLAGILNPVSAQAPVTVFEDGSALVVVGPVHGGFCVPGAVCDDRKVVTR